jgi:signal transduction histidine kinase
MSGNALARAEKVARWRVGLRIAFYAHAIAYGSTVLLLAVLFFPAAVIVALAWGIGLSLHYFFAVAVPELRDRWIASELERAARAAQRKESEGEHARRTERLAASLAHEIRNPIAAAKSLVRQIAEDPGAPDAKEYARVAEGELDRVEASIAHLLRFSREEPLRVGRVQLADVARVAVDSVRERAMGARIETSVEGVELDADEDKVRRTIVNLVSNAADAVAAMPEDRRAIRVEGGPSADLRTVWLRVKDAGPGIDPAVRDRIFEPWVTGKDSGTGLGLPIARKLCEAHGGTLEVEETSVAGTSMLVTLPRASSIDLVATGAAT